MNRECQMRFKYDKASGVISCEGCVNLTDILSVFFNSFFCQHFFKRTYRRKKKRKNLCVDQFLGRMQEN